MERKKETSTQIKRQRDKYQKSDINRELRRHTDHNTNRHLKRYTKDCVRFGPGKPKRSNGKRKENAIENEMERRTQKGKSDVQDLFYNSSLS